MPMRRGEKLFSMPAIIISLLPARVPMRFRQQQDRTSRLPEEACRMEWYSNSILLLQRYYGAHSLAEAQMMLLIQSSRTLAVIYMLRAERTALISLQQQERFT